MAILPVILRESKWTTEESDYGVHPVDAKIVDAGFKLASTVLPVGQVFNPTVATPDVVSVSGPVQDRQECLSYHPWGFAARPLYGHQV